MLHPLCRLTLGAAILAAPLLAGCPESFSKAGNVMTGTRFESSVTVPDLSVADAIAQLHGIAAKKNLDILTEDVENGTMALEDRASMRHKAIPYVVTVTAEGDAANIQLMVKLNKGAITKTEAARDEICSMLAQVQGGAAGRAAAAAGAEATTTAPPRRVDVFVFSREIAREARDSAESIPLRYRNRSFTLTGRVDYVIKDGDVYRVAFKIPDVRDLPIRLSVGTEAPAISVNCMMAPNQAAWALALRSDEKVALTGTYLDFNQFKHAIWLGGCKHE